MKTLGIFTTSRAEFGLLVPLLKEIEATEGIAYLLFCGGAHLVSEQGKTIAEIKKRGFEITDTFDFLLNEDSPFSLGTSSGIATMQLARIFSSHRFDFTLIPGDRFELLSIAQTSIIFGRPIVHIGGGEISQGAIDEQIRHMLTKAAHIHFTGSETYAHNIKALGEEDYRIVNTGELGIDNIKQLKKRPKNELFAQYQLKADLPLVVMTYHPVTLENVLPGQQQVANIFRALNLFEVQVLVTSPNIDSGHDAIFNEIQFWVGQNPDFHYTESMGVVNYHSALACTSFVIGNSSSGIIEVPYFKIPTINVGDRQKGRLMHKSIINCRYDEASIAKAIQLAMNESFRKEISRMDYKFGDGFAARKMVKYLLDITISQEFLRKKLIVPDWENTN